MQHIGDHDGKSQTSSAVDAKHYPEMTGREQEEELAGQQRDDSGFSHSEIEQLAYELWEKAGCPAGSHERDWHEAERQLLEARREHTDSKTMAAQAGSVQR